MCPCICLVPSWHLSKEQLMNREKKIGAVLLLTNCKIKLDVHPLLHHLLITCLICASSFILLSFLNVIFPTDFSEPFMYLLIIIAAILKRPRTPPTNNPALDYQTADSEHVLKRSRPFGISDEVHFVSICEALLI